MPQQQKAKRPRGRPRTGKEGYCIRMSPITYDTLNRAAEAEEMRLGDWLDDLARAKSSSASVERMTKRLGLVAARVRFLEVAGRVTDTIRLLHDVFDLQPAIGQDGEVQEAVWYLDDAYRRLRQFLVASDAMPLERRRGSVRSRQAKVVATKTRCA